MSEIENLDDMNLFQRLDAEGMLVHLRKMPESCQQAWRTALEFDLPSDYSQIEKVIILGMGGSAIGGDLLKSLATAEARVPLLVHRDYDLPAFTDARTLVIASSYSGRTEETLSAFDKALRTPARKLAITTGGDLADIAGQNGVPVLSIGYQAPPRAALPFSFLPVLAFLQRLGFIADKSADVTEMVSVMRSLSARIKEDVPLSANPAKRLATRLYRHLPVVYGGGVLAEVAHRWKTQFNENAKAWSFYEVLPELNHNAVVGYHFPQELAPQIAVVLLRSASLFDRIKLRYDVTCQLLDQAKVGYEVIDADGNSPLSQMMSLVLFGDYVSCYLAFLYQIDPSPVAVIDYLKKKLAEG
ncbi:MAG: bifunctional phosphoglucose/phosphomannose isomerase [Dehalococcoidales bacterium]|nr:bifunctional phosphoglucose/phosphomannose isomerase [Dehalococcoidales bacterium]